MAAERDGKTAGPVVVDGGPAHAEVIAALRAECFDEAWSDESIRSLLRTPGTFALIAEVGGGPGGFVLARVAADEAEILVVAVRPALRRSGIGGRLLDAALVRARAAGAVRMFLEVAVDNRAALALYGSRGFTEAGRRPNYYTHPGRPATDALILGLALG